MLVQYFYTHPFSQSMESSSCFTMYKWGETAGYTTASCTSPALVILANKRTNKPAYRITTTNQTLANLLNFPLNACDSLHAKCFHVKTSETAAVSLEQTALLFLVGLVEWKNALEWKEKNKRNGRREISNKHARPRSPVLLDGNGAIASCWIVPVHQALQWFHEVPILVRF